MLCIFWGISENVGFRISLEGDNMLKYSPKCLTILLTIVSAVSIINVFVMYWFPINIPFSSFSAVRLTFVALVEKRYYLILISALICILLFLSAVSVRRRYFLTPFLSLIYLTYDLARILTLLVDGFGDGYGKPYIIQTMILVTLIVLLCIYCSDYFRYSRTGDGSLS